MLLGNGDGSLDDELLSEEEADSDDDDDDKTNCTIDREREADFVGLQVSYDVCLSSQLKVLRATFPLRVCLVCAEWKAM